MTQRDTCIFYRSIYEAIKDLPPNTKLEVYDSVFAFLLDFKEPELEGLSKTIFTLIEPVLRNANKNYVNGSKPKTKPNTSQIEAKDKPIESETEAYKYKDKDKYKDDDINEDDLSVRPEPKPKSFKTWTYEQFNNSIAENKELFERSLLLDFQKYWTEISPSGKLRFQLQPTWDTKKRLERWKANNFNKAPNKPQQPAQFSRASLNHFV
jgi:hypothetical protein